MPGCTGEFAYSVVSSAVQLHGMGEYCLVGPGRFNGKDAERNVLHAVGLNDIELSVLRAGLLLRWTSSGEIRSQNELALVLRKTMMPWQRLALRAEEQRFVLESEPMRYYKDVASVLGREAHVNRVLNVVSNYDLLQFSSGFFRNSPCRVFFGLVKDWHTQPLDTRFVVAQSPAASNFGRLFITPLPDVTTRQRSAPERLFCPS